MMFLSVFKEKYRGIESSENVSHTPLYIGGCVCVSERRVPYLPLACGPARCKSLGQMLKWHTDLREKDKNLCRFLQP